MVNLWRNQDAVGVGHAEEVVAVVLFCRFLLTYSTK
jgi:hypothetical protein